MPTRLRGIVALLLVTVVWGTTFPVMKELSAHFSPVWIVVMRFSIAGLLLSPFLWRAQRADLLAGCLLGFTLFVCSMLQFSGLALTSSNRNAFITGLNVLVVPVLGMLAGKPPERKIAVAIMLAMAGLFALCWDSGSWGNGDTLALCGACGFGVYVKLLERLSPRVGKLMVLTAAQIMAVAVCGLVWLLLVDMPTHATDWRQFAQGGTDAILSFLYLAVIATAAIIFLQAWGQKYCSANEAAVIYAFEPACAAIAGYFWLGEMMTWRALVGAMLLIAGMIVSQWTSKTKARDVIGTLGDNVMMGHPLQEEL